MGIGKKERSVADIKNGKRGRGKGRDEIEKDG